MLEAYYQKPTVTDKTAVLAAVPVTILGAGQISAKVTGGLSMYARGGVGTHYVVLDVTTPEAEITDTINSIDVVVLSPTEETATYSAKLPFLAAKGTTWPQVYLKDVTTALGVETHKFMAFKHNFAQRGEHRISIRFKFGSLGDQVTTVEAVRVDIGDGFFPGII